jgi:hypothetical protein
VATKAPAKKATAKKKPASRPTAPATAEDSAAIGVNPERRYGSAGSRALRR